MFTAQSEFSRHHNHKTSHTTHIQFVFKSQENKIPHHVQASLAFM
jgi:hypothetical protein